MKRKYWFITLKVTFCISFIFLLTACSGISKKTTNISENNYVTDFQPIPPIKFDENNKLKTKEKKENYFTGFSSYVFVKRITADGKVEIPITSITGEAGAYQVIMDFVAYDIKQVNNIYGKFGVGLRITANIETKSANLNIGGLMNIVTAAKASELYGTLMVEVFGISSEESLTLIPLTSEIDMSSINAILMALASIKSKIFDDNTTISPYLIAIRKNSTTESIEAANNSFSKAYKEGYEIGSSLVQVKSLLLKKYSDQKLEEMKKKINTNSDYQNLRAYFPAELKSAQAFENKLEEIFIDSKNNRLLYLIAYLMEV